VVTWGSRYARCVEPKRWPEATGRDGDDNVDRLHIGSGDVVERSAANAYEDVTCPDVVPRRLRRRRF